MGSTIIELFWSVSGAIGRLKVDLGVLEEPLGFVPECPESSHRQEVDFGTLAQPWGARRSL